jgi:hypothetical protein
LAESGNLGTSGVHLPDLIPDWKINIAPNANRDVTDIIEMPTLSTWDPEQDMSKDNREIISPSRMIE